MAETEDTRRFGWPDQSITFTKMRTSRETVHISALDFERAFEIFRTSEDGLNSEDFASSKMAEREGYKLAVRMIARERLEIQRWKRAWVGSGKILDDVVASIEIKESPALRNNLVRWEPRWGKKARSHHTLLEARKSPPQLTDLEDLLWRFFKDKISNNEFFESLQSFVGRKYDIIAYLFYPKDDTRFMPILTSRFDRAFQQLNVPLRTSGQASWHNYQKYLSVLETVRELLSDLGHLPNARLLDAHTFCFILGHILRNVPAEEPTDSPQIAAPVRGAIRISPVPESTYVPRTDFRTVSEADFIESDALRRQRGRLAQEIALISERRRLAETGHDNPAEAATRVWDKPGHGYDIKSCEPDGRDRYIEVKAVGRQTGAQIYITSNEWQASRHLENYFFYLVFECDSDSPRVVEIPASDLDEENLSVATYVASIRLGRG